MAESKQEERDAVRRREWMGSAFALTVFFVGYFIVPFPVPPLPSVLDRVLYTLQWQTLSCLMLAAGITVAGLTRFATTAIDPIRGKGGDRLAVHLAFTTNTLEQLILNALGQIVLSTYLRENQMKIIPILVFLFIFGRIAFWIGYLRSSLERSFGFIVTFGPTLMMYLFLVYKLFTSGPLGALL